MARINLFQIVKKDHHLLYKKGYPYSCLCFQSNIHPSYYDDVTIEELKVYIKENFGLLITIYKFDGVFGGQVSKIDGEYTWIWGKSFDTEDEAWEFACLKTIQLIHDLELEMIEK